MGKGGGALSAWMKEFVTLVFVQTIQAFIFAIIISIILFGMSDDPGNISADDNNAALGLMSVFALLSVFKVEDMIKKIFGISDTKASHRSALSSLAKTAMAAKIGSRVLNNTGKFLGGLRGVTQAGQDRRKLKKRLDEDMKDEGFVKGSDGKLRPVQSASTRKTNSAVGRTGTVITGDSVANVDTAIAPINQSASSAEKIDFDKLYGNTTQPQVSDAAYRRVKKSLREYEDKVAEINKARNEGIKNMVSSLAESTGAVFGGTAGGILGGADGDIEGLLQGVMAGAGVGDTVGKNTVEAVDRATKFVQRNVKREKGVSNKELKRAIDEYKDTLSKARVKRDDKINVDDIDV